MPCRGSDLFVKQLPARFLDTGDQTIAGHVAETDAADAELAIHGPCSPTQIAAARDANPLAGQHLDLVGSPSTGLVFLYLSAELDVLCFGRHVSSLCQPCGLLQLAYRWARPGTVRELPENRPQRIGLVFPRRRHPCSLAHETGCCGRLLPHA